MALSRMPMMAANAKPERCMEPIAMESLAPYFTPMAMTRISAAMIMFRISIKSMFASTMLRIPTEEIMP